MFVGKTRFFRLQVVTIMSQKVTKQNIGQK